jgi:hypothetical protein
MIDLTNYEADLLELKMREGVANAALDEMYARHREEYANAKKGTKRATRAKQQEESSAAFKAYTEITDKRFKLEQAYYYWLCATGEAMGGKLEHYAMLNVFPY